jgi:hypothetical protein
MSPASITLLLQVSQEMDTRACFPATCPRSFKTHFFVCNLYFSGTSCLFLFLWPHFVAQTGLEPRSSRLSLPSAGITGVTTTPSSTGHLALWLAPDTGELTSQTTSQGPIAALARPPGPLQTRSYAPSRSKASKPLLSLSSSIVLEDTREGREGVHVSVDVQVGKGGQASGTFWLSEMPKFSEGSTGGRGRSR